MYKKITIDPELQSSMSKTLDTLKWSVPGAYPCYDSMQEDIDLSHTGRGISNKGKHVFDELRIIAEDKSFLSERLQDIISSYLDEGKPYNSDDVFNEIRKIAEDRPSLSETIEGIISLQETIETLFRDDNINMFKDLQKIAKYDSDFSKKIHEIIDFYEENDLVWGKNKSKDSEKGSRFSR